VTAAVDRPTEVAGGPASRPRVVALDAVRGLAVVVLLTAMHPGPRDAFPYHYRHPEWHGLSFIDLFFPVFLFAVGASIPFSSRGQRAGPVVARAGKLFLLGVVLGAATDQVLKLAGVLQHIAIAYLLAWAVLRLPRWAQAAVFLGALAAVWAAFLAFAEGPDPWAITGGFAHEVNGWFFGAFRTEGVPQSAVSALNVLVGAWCGRLVREATDPRTMVRRAALGAVVLVLAGLVLSGWVPLNKKLWTPSYVLVGSGASVAFFAAFAWVSEVRRRRSWTQPLVELGSNAIGVYVAVILALGLVPEVRGPVDRALEDLVPPAVVTWGWAAAWLLLGWLICRALYHRRLFLTL
jgi:predicted acyltransferase